MERILELENEISVIRTLLSSKERELYELKKRCVPLQRKERQSCDDPLSCGDGPDASKKDSTNYGSLPKWAIERYSRQILLPEIGAAGQQKLCEARVLIVGAGGLGCPAAAYLAAAGVGEIGIIDHDTVDLTNIHRQILHGEADQHLSKAESAAQSLHSINSRIKITPYNTQLTSLNAREIAEKYDLILDCTDNVPTRYLLNDVSVFCKIPLISGSALKLEGQLTIYGYRGTKIVNDKEVPYRGPCYRCVFPAPPPPAAVGSCASRGVAGPVPALVGVVQAMEAMKYIVGFPRDKMLVGRLLLFDAEDVSCRIVHLRSANPHCAVCSDKPTIRYLVDYENFCKAHAKEKDLDLKILPPENRISATVLSTELASQDKEKRHLLVDVRSEQEFHMCNIDGAVNYPIDDFTDKCVEKLAEEVRNGTTVTFVCRRGNDSQLAAEKLIQALEPQYKGSVKDLDGGLHAWAKHVDSEFPVY